MVNPVALSEEEMRTFLAHESSEIHRIYLKLFELGKRQTVETICLADPIKLPILQGKLQTFNEVLNYMPMMKALVAQKEHNRNSAVSNKVVPIRR